ncbi:hypothetical protein V8F33_007670 [Rhypophila sp. PSN 637]
MGTFLISSSSFTLRQKVLALVCGPGIQLTYWYTVTDASSYSMLVDQLDLSNLRMRSKTFCRRVKDDQVIDKTLPTSQFLLVIPRLVTSIDKCCVSFRGPINRYHCSHAGTSLLILVQIFQGLGLYMTQSVEAAFVFSP